MDITNKSQTIRSEVLRSPSLYFKEFEATEKINKKKHRLLSGTRIKAVLVPLMYWVIKHAPKWCAMLPIHLLIVTLRLMYIFSNNPYRKSCEDICQLARDAGFTHQPKQIYGQILNNLLGTAENYYHLYRHGIDSVIDTIELNSQHSERMNRLSKEYGGVILMAPHNFASVFSALKMNRAFPLLIVSRNSSTIDRTKTALDFFERMQVSVLMVRGGNSFELSRALFAELKKGTVIAATVDSIEGHSDTTVHMFGQEVGFSSWASKIGVKKNVPIIPSYFRSIGRQVVPVFGEEIVTDDIESAMQHYAEFFERQILEDPASWAFLGDKRWRKVLHEASQ